MKIIRILVTLYIALLVNVTCSVLAKADNTALTICYENIENIPYYYGEGSEVPQTRPGLYVDILGLVSQRLNLDIKYHRASWARCLKELETNRVDGVLAGSYKQERAKYGHYPMTSGKLDIDRRIVNKSYYIFKRKGSDVSWDGTNFINLQNIGAQIGYAIIDFLEKHNLVVTETSSVQRGFMQVQNDRLEAFATLDEIGNTLLMRYPEKYNLVEKVPVPLKTKPYYLLISKGFYGKNRDLSEKIWNELASIRKKEMSDLLTKYGETAP